MKSLQHKNTPIQNYRQPDNSFFLIEELKHCASSLRASFKGNYLMLSSTVLKYFHFLRVLYNHATQSNKTFYITVTLKELNGQV